MRNILLSLVSVLIVSNCATNTNFEKISFKDINDTKEISQNPNDIIKDDLGSLKFNTSLFFSPWEIDNPHSWDNRNNEELRKEIIEASLKIKESYNEALVKKPLGEFEADLENANYDKLFTYKKPALISKNTNLRRLPTLRHYFDDPTTAGEGYPFDYGQESSLYLGTPVRISHYSKDKAWVFIFSNDKASGFVKVSDLVELTVKQAEEYKEHKLAVVIKENSPIYNNKGEFIEYLKIGSYLPVKFDLSTHSNKVLIPSNGKLEWVNVQNNYINSGFLEFNKENLSKIISELINTPYGWGGYLGNRDCSQFIKDIYASFGVYLPRNSRDQAEFFESVDIFNLSKDEKINFLKNNGKAFTTLIFKRGHIGIYAGEYNGKPIMLHDVWGVVLAKNKEKGRNIIGRSLFSYLDFGKELENYSNEDAFINKISKIIFLSEK
ncbi:MAG: SH3 domain-containing protein [Sphingobacteriia bacterium]|nr:SH3 domain-containing protein [Sphingobacteriia bacterium]